MIGLTPSCPVVLPKLLPLALAADPRLRHGALHALTEVTTCLCSLRCPPSNPVSAVLGEELVQQLVDLVPQVYMHNMCSIGFEFVCFQLESHGVFRGAAGECMRPAALGFISKMCECLLPVAGHSALGTLRECMCVAAATIYYSQPAGRE